jgi:hypothetical protein
MRIWSAAAPPTRGQARRDHEGTSCPAKISTRVEGANRRYVGQHVAAPPDRYCRFRGITDGSAALPLSGRVARPPAAGVTASSVGEAGAGKSTLCGTSSSRGSMSPDSGAMRYRVPSVRAADASPGELATVTSIQTWCPGDCRRQRVAGPRTRRCLPEAARLRRNSCTK